MFHAIKYPLKKYAVRTNKSAKKITIRLNLVQVFFIFPRTKKTGKSIITNLGIDKKVPVSVGNKITKKE